MQALSPGQLDAARADQDTVTREEEPVLGAPMEGKAGQPLTGRQHHACKEQHA